MKGLKEILVLVVAALSWGCTAFDESVQDLDDTLVKVPTVEVLEDGRIRVCAQLSAYTMDEIEVSSRAASAEESIYDGWCLIFGEDVDERYEAGSVYTDASPLLQKVPLVVNANGTFFMTFDTYDAVAFVRIVVNLTDREETALAKTNAWVDVVKANPGANLGDNPSTTDVITYSVGTFGDYRYQSVGLDGLYNITYTADYDSFDTTNDTYTYSPINTNAPDPNNDLANAFPMSSYGFVMDEITEDSLLEVFDNIVYMIRTCSKVEVTVTDSNFTLYEVHMIDCAQEARVRSTVLESTGSDGTEVTTSLDIPTDLGGTITYAPLVVSGLTSGGGSTSPVYFYPNSGGAYNADDVVNQKVNPQYVVIKGRASGYDTDGYYKIALKAQYPLSVDSDESNMDDTAYWTALTYDVLRNTNFKINLIEVNKPGYKTLADAVDVNSPASNISYSITIKGEDSRNEFLVSNGTYFVELEGSRVYAKGYTDDGVEGCSVEFILNPNDINGEYDYFPTAYVQSDGGVTVTSVTANSVEVDLVENKYDDFADEVAVIESSNVQTRVKVTFDAISSGRVRLRIGDMLKFVPVVYDPTPISMYGTSTDKGTTFDKLSIGVGDEAWGDFSYEAGDMSPEEGSDNILESDGTITNSNVKVYEQKEFRARIYPAAGGGGVTKLYIVQASDFAIIVDDADGDGVPDGDVVLGDDENTMTTIEYAPKGFIYKLGTFEKTDKTDMDVVYGCTGDKIEISNIEGSDHFSQVLEGNNITFTANPDEYSVEATKTSEAEFLASYMSEPYTETTIITLSNAAGDTKEYSVEQTLYPPIYIINNKSYDTKSYCMYYTNGFTDVSTVYVYVLNMYNYYDKTGYSYSYSWGPVSGATSYETDIERQLLPEIIYDTSSYYTNNTDEYASIGGYKTADAAIGVWRDDCFGVFDRPSTGSAKLTITVYDVYGEQYTASMQFTGSTSYN